MKHLITVSFPLRMEMRGLARSVTKVNTQIQLIKRAGVELRPPPSPTTGDILPPRPEISSLFNPHGGSSLSILLDFPIVGSYFPVAPPVPGPLRPQHRNLPQQPPSSTSDLP